MKQINQDLERLLDNRVGALAFDVHDEADAARIMLVSGVVQSLRWGQTWHLHTRVIRYSASISKRNLQMPSMHSASVLPMREAHGSYSKKGKGTLFPLLTSAPPKAPSAPSR